MTASADSSKYADVVSQVEAAAQAGKLTASAVGNLKAWLTEPRYAEYAARVAELVAAARWRELDDAFWTVIPFGTGGRRGKMFPVGSNSINDRTMGESAQGLADYVLQVRPGPGEPSCAIAYDTRHRSRHFAELCAEVMAASGFKVWFLDGYRSTPELSFAVRHQGCSCGIMITASHNPPSDNAVKVYWNTGGQLLPPHDRGVIDRVMSVETIKRTPFEMARSAGQIVYCQEQVDRAYLAQLAAQALPGPRELKVLYSPMHGVGASSVVPALQAIGFKDVEVFGPHAAPDGDFPNVPGHVANPENPATFDAPIERAKAIGADVILSTDPDADRLGCAAPLVPGGEWRTFTGNQIGALLTEYLLAARKMAGRLSPDQYLVKTLVTTELVRRIGDHYGVRTEGDLQVGFKYIGGIMDQCGPEKFLLGIEESHGYLCGHYARDKDAAVAAVLLACLAAQVKAAGQTLHQKLESLFWQYGCHVEKLVTKTMPGAEGMQRMKALMELLRSKPPRELAGLKVRQVRDYENLVVIRPEGGREPLEGPRGDLVIFDLAAEGNYVAVRPSGTEPKVKFYLFAYEPAEQIAQLDDTRAELAARLDAVYQALAEIADRA
ncbi:MAG: phospho-sugar mutase [Pirellulales bacterium]|nr:phospho-sugar mutase [Pirellulales bacterium]